MKKLFMGLAMLLLLVCFAGCGTEKPKDTADQAILAFGELYGYGDTTNAAKTGMVDSDVNKVKDQFQKAMNQSFAAYKLSPADQQEMTDYYLKAIKTKMEMKAKIKTDSDKNPVVSLSFKLLDQQKFTSMIQTNPGMVQLNEIATAMAEEGQDVTQDPDYPATMKKILKSCIDNLPMQAEKTVDIECQLAKDKNDKVFWNPKDVNALANAVGGK